MKSIFIYKALIIAIVILFTIIGCQKNAPDNLSIPEPMEDNQGKMYFNNKEELQQWALTSDDVIKTRKIGEFEFTLKQITPDMMALQELNNNTNDEAAFNEAKSHYTDLFYFKLNIQNPKFPRELLKYNLEKPEDYGERVKYCSFHLNEDIKLTNGKDTVPCAIHEFERTFNLQSGLNFMVTFSKIDASHGLTVVYHDKLFQHGLIKFNYKNDPSKSPYLKI